jgi:transcription elongation factor GreA
MRVSDDDFASDDLATPAPSSGGSASSTYDEEEETLITKEGLKKLKEELDYLKTARRKEVAQRLKEAISYGDLSENSEYEEAKNEQAFIEGRILELEQKIKSAKIIAEHDVKGKEVTIGSSVTVRNITDKEEEALTYAIVGATEADPFEGKISNESPIGKALLTRRKGDQVTVPTPSGIVEYEIVKVA